jgi:hypothetical protein
VVSILGSTGIFGGLLLLAFFLQKLLQRTSGMSREDAAFASALKLSLLPYLAMNQLGGTIPDIGVTAAISLGLLSSVPFDSTSRIRARQISLSSPQANGAESAARAAGS